MSVRRCPPLDGVRKIAVLRPNAVGDFVFALPALHALKQTYHEAELVLLGKPWHAAFLRERPGPVDRVVVVPPLPGIGAPDGAPPDPVAAQDFVQRMRGERFDIAAQMFGGGRHSNRFLMRFGARLSVGARADDARPLDRWVRYAEPNNRRLALLEVAALAGAAPVMPEPELVVTNRDRHEAAMVLPALPRERLALLQPGSTDPRRRWPAERFAFVGDALARAGARVVVNGSAAEAPLVQAVAQGMRAPPVNLAGRLSLGGLCGLLERAALVVSNDTGPLHLALAIGTPAVGIFWLTNLIDGTPLRQGLLRVALSVRVECPVCGAENLRERCPHDDSFVDDVPALEVAEMATSLLRAVR
jgi:ADP-heptose:LPS heptosyltransferase